MSDVTRCTAKSDFGSPADLICTGTFVLEKEVGDDEAKSLGEVLVQKSFCFGKSKHEIPR